MDGAADLTYHPSMPAFGYDPENPLPAVARLIGLVIAIYGFISENPPVAYTGLAIGAIGLLLYVFEPKKSPPVDTRALNELSDEEFERQMADYEAGRRKTLPGQ